MKWTIDKTFNWEMGHRVWTQKLEHEHLSLSTECACKHLHGHSYLMKVFLVSDKLDSSQMVTDFKNLNFVKRFVDDVLDHKFMIDINDPNFELITGVPAKEVKTVFVENFTNLGELILHNNADVQLHRNSFVLVNFVPTSENICFMLKDKIQRELGNVAKVEAIELWETAKSHCRYED